MIIRAATFQVVEPVGESWKEFRDALAEQWALTTQASNWIMRELYLRDVRRDGSAKMPKYQHCYLYPELRVQFPNLTPQSVASIERAVTAKYKAKRYETVWTSAASLPNFRYPVPYPVHNQSWDCWYDDGNRPMVSVRIGAGETGKRWQLRLSGGQRYRRQLAAFRAMVDGQAKRGEMALFKNHDGEILCKMVYRAEPKSAKELSGVLRVRTDDDRLVVALDEKDERIWNLNFDHVRRWIAEHADTLQRLREDRKAENRPAPSFESRQEALVSKHRRRMDSAVKEAAAQICGFALRRRFSAIRYDDSRDKYAPSFPWYALRQRIATKCEDLGLVFDHVASGGAATEAAESLAVE